MTNTRPMFRASADPRIGSDRQVVSGLRENPPLCAARAAEMPDRGVNLPLHPMPRQNVVARNRFTLQYHLVGHGLMIIWDIPGNISAEFRYANPNGSGYAAVSVALT